MAFALLIHYRIGWLAVFEAWTTLPPHLVVIPAVLLAASYVLRALRMYDYFRRRLGGRFRQCLRLILLHTLFNNMLPMRSGEIAFPVLMKQYFGIRFDRSVPALAWFRLMDLHVLILAGGVAYLWDRIPLWLLAAAGLAFLVSPVLFFHARYRIEASIGQRSGKLSQLVLKAAAGVPDTPASFVRCWVWTGMTWTVKLAAFTGLLMQFANASLPTALLGSLLGEFTSVLPVHGIAGTGTYEGGIVAALVPLGIGLDTAVAAAVNLHLFLLGGIIIGAAAAILLLPSASTGPETDCQHEETP